MNLYFAGWGSKDADAYLRTKKAHRLLSQANEKRVIESWVEDGLADRLFIDSGAFTVAHSGAELDINDYIAYIESYPDIKNWAELDVIPYPVLNAETAKDCSQASWDNYLYMKKHIKSDCNILPIYHFGEPEDGLRRILNTEVDGKLVDYIGVGGRHGVSTDEQIKYFHEVFSIISSSDNPNVKVHAFGITVPKILQSFPFYSADSTLWLQAAINGYILAEDTLLHIIIGQRLSHHDSHDSISDMLIPTISKYGYDLNELRADYKLRLRYNIDIMLNWEKHYTYKGQTSFKSQRLF